MNQKNETIKNMEEKVTGSQSLVRGLHLLDILSNYPNGCPLARIAELAQLNKSTTHRLLQSLQCAGYVKPALAAGSYRLSTKCLALGQKVLSSINIINVAAPHLEQLNLTIGETINFSYREDDQVILIYKLEPTTGMIRTRSYIGQYMQLYCSAMGKLFLAYDSSIKLADYWERNQNIIQQLTFNTITNLSIMQQELVLIRQNGFAMDREENELGISCIAVPVFNLKGKIQYTISVSLSTIKLSQLGHAHILKPLLEAARNISEELGWTDTNTPSI
ncbi:transcriptional regulator [Gallibacterium salpingitidis]|uniref:Transcriptional regulator n=1 Tax=Gallibacterium salpingitidis TaxID=505341 RepID=A0A1A7NUX9_9PAST|nr:IclR family transcriptional regulator [Gallibacterium salpingitidis]OBW93375.1 transcriptional regulator [Gallibacterium salpingitidis]OBX07470.1 transcriptional regulator [Gallibacterium salpingitidis]OBX10821.1 transcriptional regulator [Gallibacterium salpingitidis]WKS99192.1 IclR family transcriptional regulator [Gallibacterium salpingitidis]